MNESETSGVILFEEMFHKKPLHCGNADFSTIGIRMEQKKDGRYLTSRQIEKALNYIKEGLRFLWVDYTNGKETIVFDSKKDGDLLKFIEMKKLQGKEKQREGGKKGKGGGRPPKLFTILKQRLLV